MKRFVSLLSCIVVVAGTSIAQLAVPSRFNLDSAHTSLSLPPANSVSHAIIQDSVLWIGTSKGLAASRNGARTWESFRTNPSFANDGIFAIEVRGATIWASTGFEKDVTGGSVQTGSGYAFSTDGGISWTHTPQPIDARSDSFLVYGLDTLRILPVIVPEQNVSFDISLSAGKVWVASWASGLRLSTDNGQTWQRILLPPDNLNRIAPRGGLNTDTLRFYVDPRRNNNFLAFAVYAVDNDTIWCGTAGGVNKSTDRGVSWTRFTHRNQQSSILGNWVIAIKEQRFQNKRRIWTTNWKADDNTEEFGVSYTDNGGRSWTNLLRGIRAYEFVFRYSVAYISTENGLYRTDDDGTTFVRSGNIDRKSVV